MQYKIILFGLFYILNIIYYIIYITNRILYVLTLSVTSYVKVKHDDVVTKSIQHVRTYIQNIIICYLTLGVFITNINVK